jgi:putative hydrolase of the HAD superfamily
MPECQTAPGDFHGLCGEVVHVESVAVGRGMMNTSKPWTPRPETTRRSMPQHLIVDADDTLWENNIYFDRAFDQFVDFLSHSTLSPQQIRDVLDDIERANAQIHGYGSANYGRNMAQCYERLVERRIDSADLCAVMRFAERILEQPIEVLAGVAETLESLAERHELTLFTKGNAEEQRLKIDRSGLATHFSHTAIVHEKDASAYRALVEERQMEPSRCWMIGNSPRSDINPALEAGLNAVFVPHARTWTLEREEIRSGGGRLITVNRFADLLEHF